nr:hypothetical protein BgiMline_020211 [Biomphalaria glabrata]
MINAELCALQGTTGMWCNHGAYNETKKCLGMQCFWLAHRFRITVFVSQGNDMMILFSPLTDVSQTQTFDNLVNADVTKLQQPSTHSPRHSTTWSTQMLQNYSNLLLTAPDIR